MRSGNGDSTCVAKPCGSHVINRAAASCADGALSNKRDASWTFAATTRGNSATDEVFAFAGSCNSAVAAAHAPGVQAMKQRKSSAPQPVFSGDVNAELHVPANARAAGVSTASPQPEHSTLDVRPGYCAPAVRLAIDVARNALVVSRIRPIFRSFMAPPPLAFCCLQRPLLLTGSGAAVFAVPRKKIGNDSAETPHVSQDESVIEFGAFKLNRAERSLESASGERIQLTRKLYDTLLYMVERPGRLIEKKALLDTIWRGSVVEENTLSRTISALRHALGERTGEQRYIETVSGVGYRFIQPVHVTRAPARESPAQRREPSLAVLPFEDLSREHDQGYFADGIAEELLSRLANVQGLRLIARTSSFAVR